VRAIAKSGAGEPSVGDGRSAERAGAAPTPASAAEDSDELERLLAAIRSCRVCAADLPLGPRPMVRASATARLLIVSQAPSIRVHQSGLSFNDRSGDRLRDWLGLDRATFYDASRVAIMPMGFCYPGSNGKSGDLPPRPECAPLWHAPLRALLPAIGLTLLVGRHAIAHYLPELRAASMTRAVERWRDFLPAFFVLPHPSWHTTHWLRGHPWFANEVLPELRARVAAMINSPMPRCAPCPRR
jgi:uracil-DNA glycosylase